MPSYETWTQTKQQWEGQIPVGPIKVAEENPNVQETDRNLEQEYETLCEEMKGGLSVVYAEDETLDSPEAVSCLQKACDKLANWGKGNVTDHQLFWFLYSACEVYRNSTGSVISEVEYSNRIQRKILLENINKKGKREGGPVSEQKEIETALLKGVKQVFGANATVIKSQVADRSHEY